MKQQRRRRRRRLPMLRTTRRRRRRSCCLGVTTSRMMMLLLLLILAVTTTTTTTQPLLFVSSFALVVPTSCSMKTPTSSNVLRIRGSSSSSCCWAATTTTRRTLSSSSSSSHQRRRTTTRTNSSNNDNDESNETADLDERRSATSGGFWKATSKLMGGIATLGAIETAYLTYTKLVGVEPSLCTENGSCGSVLSGPYSSLSIGDSGIQIPIAALGFLAYSTVAVLAFTSNNNNQIDDGEKNNNMVYIKAISTGMGTFSLFLMTLLFGVLKEMCVLCVTSALLSTSLMYLSWMGGDKDQEEEKDRARDNGVNASIGTSLTATAAAVVLFMSNNNDALLPSSPQQDLGAPPMTKLLASTSSSSSLLPSAGSTATADKDVGEKPPPITTKSTKRTIEIANGLQKLNTNFYGAFWCSHCYEQKQELGAQAMSKINYVECSKDGYNSQTSLCRSKKVPGYPTWEINGILYPGEQALEELEDIILMAKDISSATTK